MRSCTVGKLAYGLCMSRYCGKTVTGALCSVILTNAAQAKMLHLRKVRIYRMEVMGD